jgi:hypothetical protein
VEERGLRGAATPRRHEAGAYRASQTKLTLLRPHFASKIGREKGIDREAGGDAGELQQVPTQSYSKDDDLSRYWKMFIRKRRFEIRDGAGVLTRVP